MSEWSTFADGEDCQDCNHYEKQIEKQDKKILLLESGLSEIQKMVDDREAMQTLGLMMLGPISRKLKQIIEGK